jgi:hypothetical protein
MAGERGQQTETATGFKKKIRLAGPDSTQGALDIGKPTGYKKENL